MGNMSSSRNKCNYHCPVCRATGKTPNLAGRFHLVSDTHCQCNACNSIFEKGIVYKPVVFAMQTKGV
jgi:hypothetical protein